MCVYIYIYIYIYVNWSKHENLVLLLVCVCVEIIYIYLHTRTLSVSQHQEGKLLFKTFFIQNTLHIRWIWTMINSTAISALKQVLWIIWWKCCIKDKSLDFNLLNGYFYPGIHLTHYVGSSFSLYCSKKQMLLNINASVYCFHNAIINVVLCQKDIILDSYLPLK